MRQAGLQMVSCNSRLRSGSQGFLRLDHRYIRNDLRKEHATAFLVFWAMIRLAGTIY